MLAGQRPRSVCRSRREPCSIRLASTPYARACLVGMCAPGVPSVHPAGVDVQRARAVREHVACHGPGEGLADEPPEFLPGLEGRSPALPAGGILCRRRADSRRELAAVVLDPRAGAVLVGAGDHAPDRRRLGQPGALGTCRLVDRLGNVQALGEAGAEQVRDAVADLQPGILERPRGPVGGARNRPDKACAPGFMTRLASVITAVSQPTNASRSDRPYSGPRALVRPKTFSRPASAGFRERRKSSHSRPIKPIPAGGSVTMASTLSGSSPASTSRQSPRYSVTWSSCQ